MKTSKKIVILMLTIVMTLNLALCATFIYEMKKNIVDKASIYAWERIPNLIRETSPSVIMINRYKDPEFTKDDEEGQGSGFFVSWQGKIYIASAGHATEDENDVQQLYYYKATWKDIASETETKLGPEKYCVFPINLAAYVPSVEGDFAIFSFDEKNLTFNPKPLKFGDSTKMLNGDWVIAIGAPSEKYPHYTIGMISHFNELTSWSKDYLYMTHSAYISGGNSGGPAINLKGEVIGINLACRPFTSISYARTSAVMKNYFIQFFGPDTKINPPTDTNETDEIQY